MSKKLVYKQVARNINLSIPNEKTLTVVLPVKTEREMLKSEAERLVNSYNDSKTKKEKDKILLEVKNLFINHEEALKGLQNKDKVKAVSSGKLDNKTIRESKKSVQKTKSNPVQAYARRGEF